MKKIACVGYHCTGAGVIDDILRECDNVAQGSYEAECKFLHSADGVRDLEFNIVENPHRLNSGFALKRYLRFVELNNRQISKIFGHKWKEYSIEYVSSLAKFEYKGWNSTSRLLFSPIQRLYFYSCKALNRLLPKPLRVPVWYNYFPNMTTYHAILSEDEFVKKTRAYTEKLAQSIKGAKSAEYVVLDQLFPGNNIEQYLKYVEDVRVVIVDRDPRDIYITQALYKEHTLPRDPNQFCVFYRDIRPADTNSDPENVLRVRFEDMVIHYDTMIAKVLSFLGIDSSHHVSPRTHFIPERSIRGIGTWKEHPEYSDVCRIIEQELPEYLYDV